jgi:glycosyltransferase involved in cell wall biosynthesis
MKIAYIEELFKLVPHGGIAVWSARLTQFLNEQGLKTDVFSYSDGIQVNIPDFLKVFPNLREIFVYPIYGKKALPQLEKKYDLFQLASPHTLAFYKPNIPSVISVHYLISRQALMLGKYLPVKYKVFFNSLSFNLFRYFEQRGMENATYITVSRQAYKDYLIRNMQIPAEKIKIVKYGIDHHFFCPPKQARPNERMVLYVGRGSLPKGFDTLVQAAKQINARVVAVASQIPVEIQREIASLRNFTVYSGISLEKLRNLYQQAYLYIMPSLTECSPISTLEAMACGLPVVCTPEGSGEYIEDGITGYIVRFKDAAHLAERVNTLLENPDLAEEFGKRNRRKVEEELNLPVIAAQLMQIYQEIA